MEKTAKCSCGQLSIRANGYPLKVSACHCKSCQRRTGSAFGVAAFYRRDDTRATGSSNTYVRAGESGKDLTFHFCPMCGSTVYWLPEFRPGLIAIAFGCLEETDGVTLDQSVCETHAHPWVNLTPAVDQSLATTPRDGNQH